MEETLSDNGLEVEIQRTFTASDACGNTSEFVQTLDVTLALEGCMDPEACNFDDMANVDDSSCTYAEGGYACDGSCLADTEGDGVCDQYEVLGCTDLSACNFSIYAKEEVSCDYCSWNRVRSRATGCWWRPAVHEDGELAGLTTYRMYDHQPTDVFSAMWGDSDTPLLITTSTSFYQHPLGSPLVCTLSIDVRGLARVGVRQLVDGGPGRFRWPNDQAPSPVEMPSQVG